MDDYRLIRLITLGLKDENCNWMVVDDVTGDCGCKLVRVLEHSVEQIS